MTEELERHELGWYEVDEWWDLFVGDVLQEVHVYRIHIAPKGNRYEVGHYTPNGECVAETTVGLGSIREEIEKREKAYPHW